MGRDEIKSLTSNRLCSEFFYVNLDSDPTVLYGPAAFHSCQASVPSNCHGVTSAAYKCGGNEWHINIENSYLGMQDPIECMLASYSSGFEDIKCVLALFLRISCKTNIIHIQSYESPFGCCALNIIKRTIIALPLRMVQEPLQFSM